MSMNILTRFDIFAYAKAQFGEVPVYLWAKTPEAAVLRHEGSRKWYALVMPVERSRLGLGGAGTVDILNLKCDPLLIGVLRTRAGFLPAYHMNKEHWITLLLDGSVEREEGLQLLEMSYSLTLPKVRKQNKLRRKTL